VEVDRLHVVTTHGMRDDSDKLPPDLHFLEYTSIIAADVFTFIVQIEFFYDKTPDAIR
jgi:hypothetical protein